MRSGGSDQLDATREEFRGCRAGEATLVRYHPDGKTDWWTFAGFRANIELAARLGPLCRSERLIDNLSISLRDDTSTEDLRATVDWLTPVDDRLDLGEEAMVSSAPTAFPSGSPSRSSWPG